MHNQPPRAVANEIDTAAERGASLASYVLACMTQPDEPLPAAYFGNLRLDVLEPVETRHGLIEWRRCADLNGVWLYIGDTDLACIAVDADGSFGAYVFPETPEIDGAVSPLLEKGLSLEDAYAFVSGQLRPHPGFLPGEGARSAK